MKHRSDTLALTVSLPDTRWYASHNSGQRDRRKVLEGVIQEKEDDYDKGALVSEILQEIVEEGFNASKVEHDLEVFCEEEGKIYYTDDQRKYIRYLD